MQAAFPPIGVYRTQGCRCPFGCGATGATALVWLVKACRACCSGEAKLRQATEIVAIVQAFWSGVSCDSIPGLELLSLRGRYQSEIMFGVLELVPAARGLLAVLASRAK
jgi:hypothetical protein